MWSHGVNGVQPTAPETGSGPGGHRKDGQPSPRSQTPQDRPLQHGRSRQPLHQGVREGASLMRHLPVFAFALMLLAACAPAEISVAPLPTVTTCPVTPWSQTSPPDSKAASYTTTWYSNGDLWAGLAPANRGIWHADPQGVDVLWLGVAHHTLSITGLELNRPSGQLQSSVSPDSPAFGGLITSLVFPYTGCWTIIGGAGDQMLVFTVKALPASTAQGVQHPQP